MPFCLRYAKAPPMNLITTTDELGCGLCPAFQPPFVTVDTEFCAKPPTTRSLCVAQMACDDEAVVIDALAPGIDLTPFFELMGNERVLKVFHAARQDIEIVWHRAGIIPHPMFDTQVAAMVLGYGDSISYDQLVQRITGDAIDKSNRFTDWSRRPLSRGADSPMRVSDVDAPARRSIRRCSPIWAAAAAPAGWTTRWRCSPRPTPTGAEPEQRLDAAQDPRAQAEGACGAHRSRGLARARGADPRRAALARAQGRRDRRHRRAGADHAGEARALRSLPKGFERSKWGEGIIDAVKRGLARDPKTLPHIELAEAGRERQRHGRAAQGAAAHDRRRRTASPPRWSRPSTISNALPPTTTPTCRRSRAGAATCSARRRWRSSTASSRW